MPEAAVAWIGEFVLEYLGETAFAAFVTAATYAPYVAVAASVYTLREQQRRAKNAYNNGLSDRYVMQRTSTAQRTLVMGRARVSGPITFLHSYGDNNTTLAMCVVLAGHECDAIEEIYFNDTPLILDGSGNVVGTKNIEHFSISGTTASFHLGAVGVNGTASAVATYDTGDVALGVSMTGDGLTLNVTGGIAGKVGSVVVTYQPYEVVYTPTRIQDSHQQQTATGSSGTFTVPSNCITSSAVVVDIAANGYQTVIGFSRAGNVITYTGATAGHQVHLMYQAGTTYSRARITKHLGGPGQTADSSLLSSLPALWTSAHRGDGLCYLKVELDYDPSTFPNGIPNVSAVVRGAKFYDPRTGTTAWTDNPAIMMRGYYLHPLGAGRDSSEVNDASVIAAANVCDGTVTYTVGTHKQTRARYKASTVASKDRRPQDVLHDIAQAMGGRWVISGNQLVVKAGAFSSPVASIDESWLHNGTPVSVQPRPNRADLTNSIIGSFADEEQSWQTVAYPAVRADAYITADGAELQTRVDYSAITYSGQAQYVSACALRYNRAGLTVRMSCNLRAFPLEVFDVVSLSLARFGWSAKTFEVIATSFTVEGLVELTLKEVDSTIWALDAAYSATDYAIKTFLPSPWQIGLPTLGTPASGTAYLLKQADGSIVSRIFVPISGITDNAVLQSGYIDVSYSRVGDPDQAWYTVTVPGDSTGAFLTGVNDGAIYLIKARTRNRLAEGNWTQQIAHQVVGKTALPATPTGFAFTDAPGGSMLSWDANTEIDYLESRLALGSTYSSATELWRGSANSFFWLQATAGTYTVWLTHRDTSGNVSTPVSLAVVVSAASASLVQIEYSVDGSTAWHTTFTTGDIYMRQRVGSTGAWQGPIRIVGQTGPAGPTGPTGATGSTGSPGTDATQAATVTLWQWSTATPTDPSGSSTYTWSSGAHSGYTGGGSWSTSIPANPGTAGIKLWQAVKTITASATTSSSTVSWASGFSVAAVSGNGNNGSAGLQSATPTVYQWASSIPAGPSGAATYTWSTASFGAAPSGWSLTPGTSPSAGFTLWAASVQVQDSAANTTTAFNWTSASITARGYAGLQGGTARYAYARIAGNPTPSTATVTTSGNSSFPGSTSWGLSASWAASDPNPSSTSTLYQTDGVYDPATGNTVWTTPYISSLKVGNLSAVAANTGSLTVDSTLTLSGSGMINQGAYTGFAWPASGTGFHLGPQGLLMGNNNTGGYVEIDSNGNYIDIGKAGGPRLLWQVSGSVGTLSLTGATLTAGLIQTSSSGTRVTINESGNNSIAFYDGASIGAYIGTGGPVTAYGFFGLASSGTKDGVYAQAYSGNGVSAYSAQSYGVNASSGGSFPAVGGSSTNGDGVYGVTNGSGHALHGKALGTGKALYAEGPAQITGAFGCNGAAPQGPKASGGTLTGVINALIANGILSS